MKISRTRQHTLNNDRDRISKIRALNDKLRITGKGGAFRLDEEAWALSYPEYSKMRQAMATDNDFNAESDPSGAHETGQQMFGEWKIIWEFEYRAKGGDGPSIDPSDANVTERVIHVELVPGWW